MPHFDSSQTREAARSASAEICGLSLGGNGYAIVNRENIRIFDLLESPDASAEELTVSSVASPDFIDTFARETGARVTAVASDSEAVLEAFSAGDAAIDLAGFASDSAARHAWLEGDLGAAIPSELLRAKAEALLPGARRLCLKDGEVVAVPTGVFVSGDVTFYPGPMEACGYTEEALPSNWMELMHFLRDYALDTPIAALYSYEDFSMQVLDRLLSAWLCDPVNIEAGFQTDKLTALLSAYREIDFSKFSYVRENQYGGLSLSDGLLALHADLDPDFSIGVGRALPLTEDDPAFAHVYCTLIALNPHSTHAELAARFAEAIASSENNASGFALLSTQPDASSGEDILKCRALYDDVSFDLLYAEKVGENVDAFTALLQTFIDGETDIPSFTAQLDAFFGL